MFSEANKFSSSLIESLVLFANDIADIDFELKIGHTRKISSEETERRSVNWGIDPAFVKKVTSILMDAIATEGRDIPLQEWLQTHKLTRLDSEQYPAACRLFAQALVDTYDNNDDTLNDLMVAFNWPSYQKDKLKGLVDSLKDVLSVTNEWNELISLVEAARGEGIFLKVKDELKRRDTLMLHHHAGIFFKEDVIQSDFKFEEAEEIEKLYRDSLVKDYYFHDISSKFNMAMSIQLPLSDIYFELGSIYGHDETELKRLVEGLFGYPVTESNLSGHKDAFESILESIVRNKKLVILGDPGSGKSITLKFIALMLAIDYGAIRVGYQVPYIPIIVSWDGFIHALNLNKSLTLAKYILDVTQESYGEIKRLKEYLSLALKNGVCLVLLDDFNFSTGYPFGGHPIKNLAKYSDEGSLNRWLDGLFSDSDLGLCPFLITRRVGTWRKMVLHGFNYVRLSPLISEENVRDFLWRWIETFLGMSQQINDSTIGNLEWSGENIWVSQLNINNPHIFSNPLLLTILGLFFSFRGYLPDRLTRILEFVTDFMIESWWREKLKLSDYQDMYLDVGIIGQILSSIAFWLQGNFTDGKVSISLWKDKISEILSLEGFEGEDKNRLLRLLSKREPGIISPIIFHEEEMCGFYHPIIEDYLTVRYLTRVSTEERQKILERFITDEQWEIIFLLLVSRLGLNEGRKREAGEFVSALINLNNKNINPTIHPVLIAGRALRVMGSYCIAKSIVDNVIQRLKSLMWDFDYSTNRPNILFNFPPVLRIQAADMLDELKWVPEDLSELIFVSDSSDSYNSEAIIQSQKKENGFWIGKYPVTNVQYERFLNSEDFLDPFLWESFPKYDENSQKMLDDWGTLGWKWLKKNPVIRKVNLNQERIYPRFWDDFLFGINHRATPVIGITWFEANAYCRWVQRHWHELEESKTSQGFNQPMIRLPTELEWEHSAGKTGAGNSFPWDSADYKSTGQEVIHRANVREGGINRTTPVGMYPLGKSHPNGIWDMAGNVWEWQANYFDSRRDTIAIRGGSWYDGLNRARRLSRNHSYPHNLWDGLGFRILACNS